MSRTNQLWMDEVEYILEEYAADVIDSDQARALLRSEGIDHDEIEDSLWAAKE